MYPLVEIVAAQVSIAAGGFDLDRLLLVSDRHFKDGHVERSAAEVINDDLLFASSGGSKP